MTKLFEGCRPVRSLRELELKATKMFTRDIEEANSYKKLTMVAAANLGGDFNNYDQARQWLETCALETTEEGVIEEVNALLEL